MEPRSPSKSKCTIMGLIYSHGSFKIGVTLFLILLFLSFGVYFTVRSGKSLYLLRRPYFTVVVDCGSTGTRVSVYQWIGKGDSSNQDLPVLVHSYPDKSSYDFSRRESCQYHCLQTEPGLDKFVGNFSGVRASLEPLIHRAEQWVPPERHGDTPIFVLATAGLRRLPRQDATRVLEDVEAIVKEHTFMYRKDWIRVLTGHEEAYYGWVALNYKMGRFNKSTGLPTLGLLDLGGSSLQVVAEMDEPKEDEDLMRSKIGPFEHHILASSWAHFGLNEAFDRTVSMLSHSQVLRESTEDTFEVHHPCLSSNYLHNYTCGGCLSSANNSGRYGSEVQNNVRNSVLLVGDPDWDSCQNLARAAAANSSSSNSSLTIDSSKCNAGVASSSGMLDLATTTHHNARFHALSGFFAVYAKLELNPIANLTKIWDKGKQLCTRSWADLNSGGDSPYPAQFCFQVPYLVSLIENALCLKNKEIVFGPGDISWTLGAALVEGDIVKVSSSRDQTNILTRKNTGLVSGSIFLLVILVCLLFILHRTQVKLPMIGKKVTTVGVSLPSYVSSKQSPS